jgi:hypothetical protein
LSPLSISLLASACSFFSGPNREVCLAPSNASAREDLARTAAAATTCNSVIGFLSYSSVSIRQQKQSKGLRTGPSPAGQPPPMQLLVMGIRLFESLLVVVHTPLFFPAREPTRNHPALFFFFLFTRLLLILLGVIG